MTDMSYAFAPNKWQQINGLPNFNSPLDCWDTGNVEFMRKTFSGWRNWADGVVTTNMFNQPLNSWNVGKVLSMERIFNMPSETSSRF